MRYSVLTAAFFALSAGASGQQLIVSAEGHHGAVPPEILKDNVSMEVNRHPAQVENWMLLRGDRAGLDLYIVIDDGTDGDIGLQFQSLKGFIEAQPASTRIGLAYLRNGEAVIAAPLTTDHAAVAKALRLPLGEAGISASPYLGISDLIKTWPPVDARREVLLIASGIDPWSPPDPQNVYLQSAITDAQRGGVLVHSIYYAEAGHLGHSSWRITWGQNYLSELGEDTGGEAYWQGFNSPVSLDPFLKDLSQRLQNQYLLTVTTEAKTGLQPVRVRTSLTGVSLTTASRINIGK